MNAGEDLDEQMPHMPRRRFNPCRCDAGRGLCTCEDDGGTTHGGNHVEMYEWTDGGLYPFRARDVDRSPPAADYPPQEPARCR